MLERSDAICLACGHAVFTVHRGHFYCCRCGGNADEVITNSHDAKAAETEVQSDGRMTT
jgi:uncharacterized Zn finger protein (UPF0148 family)